MARLLDVIQEEPRACSYLEHARASLEHHVLVEVSELELEERLRRGWRRFGPDYFRPRCPACNACQPTRVPVADFVPTKSQRRALRVCDSLEIRESAPVFDEERLALYHAWHAERETSRRWEGAELSERSYRMQFTFPHPAARELTYVEPSSGRIVGVALCDETPSAYSAIYFFYHPSYKNRSLGTANVVFQIELAKARNIEHLYLGYYVEGCPSLDYKSKFTPQEHLAAYVELDEEPEWRQAHRPELPPHRR